MLNVHHSQRPFQDCMGTVLIDILRGKSEEEISDYVVDFKKSMITKETKDIAKNSAVKNLSKYLPKGKRQLFQFMKGTLCHVKCCLKFLIMMLTTFQCSIQIRTNEKW